MRDELHDPRHAGILQGIFPREPADDVPLQVDAVLLDALAVEPAAGAGALAAEQPVLLVDGDVEGAAERRVGQHPRRRERAHPSSQDCDVDLLRGPWHESSLRG